MRVGRRSHSVCHDGDKELQWRPRHAWPLNDIAARTSDLTLAQRPGESPMATGATSASRLASRRGSAGTSPGRRCSALAAVFSADIRSCRRRSGSPAQQTEVATSARVLDVKRSAREGGVVDMSCLVLSSDDIGSVSLKGNNKIVIPTTSQCIHE